MPSRFPSGCYETCFVRRASRERGIDVAVRVRSRPRVADRRHDRTQGVPVCRSRNTLYAGSERNINDALRKPLPAEAA